MEGVLETQKKLLAEKEQISSQENNLLASRKQESPTSYQIASKYCEVIKKYDRNYFVEVNKAYPDFLKDKTMHSLNIGDYKEIEYTLSQIKNNHPESKKAVMDVNNSIDSFRENQSEAQIISREKSVTQSIQHQ